jgi:deazaflavin-dependent oxidoreductase (nitroreductase family)
MAEGPYLRPPWFARVVGNRMAALLNPAVRVLSVCGRTSGQWRAVAVVVLDHAGQRYLLAPSGHTDWSRNLRTSGAGRLRHRGRMEEFTAVEIPVDQRPPLVEAYLRRYGKLPRVAAAFRKLPDPADHPAFRIVKSEPGNREDRPRD